MRWSLTMELDAGVKSSGWSQNSCAEAREAEAKVAARVKVRTVVEARDMGVFQEEGCSEVFEEMARTGYLTDAGRMRRG